MSKTKLLAAFFLPLLLTSFLQSQSLAELAKKEKERRAAIKGKAATITTEDLAKVKKRPAVESAPQELPAEEQPAQAGAEPQAGAAAAPEGEPAAEAQAGAEAEKPAEETPPADDPDAAVRDLDKRQNELADAAQEKAELVDLLTLKMNALYQQFQSIDNMKSRETLQIQISDTYDKLLKAETESAKAKKDLEDFLVQRKKSSAPQLWIK
jgi:hypothetical protein